MAVTATPIFVQAPRGEIVNFSTANTGRDGSGTLATLWTPGANGSIIDHIDVCATGTTTAGVVRLFVFDGSTYRLWKELLIPAKIPSTTIAAYSTSVDCSLPSNSLVLASGRILKASTHNAEGFNILTCGGDL